ncbi:MAG: Gfo/Idh/MocA family oxidoreductase [Bacteroidales bacterium]|nr:Gfo/Idh/MocA family oxidoreductase [Bacteroidales bacterium]
MAEKIIRWGMIGTGNVTERKSAPSFNKIENSRLVAVGNRTPEKAEDYAARHGIATVHKDPFDVIRNTEVDIVYIATPPGSHMSYALETIKAGKPPYIEKPMARTLEECRIINEAAEKRGLPVYVAYYRRSLEYFKKVRSIIDGGSLGKILHINMQQYFAARPEDYESRNLPWRVIPEDAGGGYFHDMGCHALDILFHIFGDPLEVSGKAINMGGLYAPEDTLSATLVLPGNLIVTGGWSFVTPKPFQKDLVEVIAEKGKLKFSIFSFKPITLFTGDHKETLATIQPEHIQMPHIQSIVSELNGTGSCPATGETSAVTSRVMDIITRKGRSSI